MKEIFKSATRIVLIVLVLTLCVMMGYVVAKNADKPEVVTQVLSIFSMVASSTVAFYFKSNNSNAQNEHLTKGIQTTEKTTQTNTQETSVEA